MDGILVPRRYESYANGIERAEPGEKVLVVKNNLYTMNREYGEYEEEEYDERRVEVSNMEFGVLDHGIEVKDDKVLFPMARHVKSFLGSNGSYEVCVFEGGIRILKTEIPPEDAIEFYNYAGGVFIGDAILRWLIEYDKMSYRNASDGEPFGGKRVYLEPGRMMTRVYWKMLECMGMEVPPDVKRYAEDPELMLEDFGV